MPLQIFLARPLRPTLLPVSSSPDPGPTPPAACPFPTELTERFPFSFRSVPIQDDNHIEDEAEKEREEVRKAVLGLVGHSKAKPSMVGKQVPVVVQGCMGWLGKFPAGQASAI
jgi:hypothetical protein